MAKQATSRIKRSTKAAVRSELERRPKGARASQPLESLGDTSPSAGASLLSQQAYELIKKDITLCRLMPGAEISETSLSNRYGFGKAPIRAALLKLSQDNLLSSTPRRGYTVAPITIRDVDEIYELRLILEPVIAGAAASHCDVAELLSLLKRLDYSASNTWEFIEAHRAFHVAIARASGNERAMRIISNLLDDAARIIHLGEFAPGRDGAALDIDHKVQQEQHRAIVDALAAGKAELAEKVMRDHIEHSLLMFRDAAFSSRSLVRLSSGLLQAKRAA